jgi:hypothetical protein
LRDFYELKFSHEFRSKFGAEFQDFFASIMEHRFKTDFQKVRPYGNVGDKKCDGYHQSLRRVFQVYAPVLMDVPLTNKKIDADFLGAIKHWKNEMSAWVFVHNQWHSGLPADVLKKLLEIDGQSAVKVYRWCQPELRELFFELDAETQAFILGPAPSATTFARIQMKDLIPVANAIARQQPPPPEQIREVPPGKLKANGLSQSVQTLLMMGGRKAKLVKDFFSQWHDPQLGDRVARSFRLKYLQLRDSGVTGDDAFLAIWKYAGGLEQQSVEHEAAVLSVLAFLFEECEIFEEPKGVNV